MMCPNCESDQIVVIDSRPHQKNIVYRRRKCLSCDYRFSTIEIEKADYESLVNRANNVEKLKRMMKML